MLDLGRESGELGVRTKVLAQTTDVFDWHENPMPLGIIQLKVLSGGAIVRPKRPGPNVPADAVSRMDNQFARLKWRGELS